MNLRESGFRMEVASGLIKPFEERILSSGMCDFALDMTFSHYRGIDRIRYDADGYVAVSEMDLTDDARLFEVFEKTLITMNKAGEFFIDRDKVLLKTETVFYNMKYKDVKLAYYPREEDICIGESVLDYMDGLAERAGESGKGYLNRVRGIFLRNNCGLKEMITVVAELRRGLFALGRKQYDDQNDEHHDVLRGYGPLQ